jgi:hypothetical protein
MDFSPRWPGSSRAGVGSRLFRKIVVVLLGAGVFVAVAAAVGGLSQHTEGSVVNAISDQGYTDVSIIDSHHVGSSWYGCSNSDSVAYEVTATNVNGKRVRLVACTDMWMKGVTIRSPR